MALAGGVASTTDHPAVSDDCGGLDAVDHTLAPMNEQGAPIPYSAQRTPCSFADIPCSSLQGIPFQVLEIATELQARMTPRAPNSRKFPVLSLRIRESARGDEFALDSPHRHCAAGAPPPRLEVCELSLGVRDRAEEARDFAGSWRPGPSDSEPETAHRGAIRADSLVCLCGPIWRFCLRWDSPAGCSGCKFAPRLRKLP